MSVSALEWGRGGVVLLGDVGGDAVGVASCRVGLNVRIFPPDRRRCGRGSQAVVSGAWFYVWTVPKSGCAEVKSGRKGRRRFVSGKVKMNTIKTTVVANQDANVLWAGAIVPGRMHDQTAVKRHGIDALIESFPDVRVLVDAGYRGLGKAHPRTGDRPAAQAGRGRHL